MTSVLLVDDHQLVRQAVGHALDEEEGLEVVAHAGTLTEGTALLRRMRPDVLVVDVSLPDGSGLELVRTAREEGQTVGIVVLTMHSDDNTLLRAADAGASALVLKTASLDDVIDAVRRSAADPHMFAAANLGAALRRRGTGGAPVLTPRERDVLVLLRDGMSAGQAAKALFMSESTVKTHIGKIYDKLGAANRAQALMTAVRQGLIEAL